MEEQRFNFCLAGLKRAIESIPENLDKLGNNFTADFSSLGELYFSAHIQRATTNGPLVENSQLNSQLVKKATAGNDWVVKW